MIKIDKNESLINKKILFYIKIFNMPNKLECNIIVLSNNDGNNHFVKKLVSVANGNYDCTNDVHHVEFEDIVYNIYTKCLVNEAYYIFVSNDEIQVEYFIKTCINIISQNDIYYKHVIAISHNPNNFFKGPHRAAWTQKFQDYIMNIGNNKHNEFFFDVLHGLIMKDHYGETDEYHDFIKKSKRKINNYIKDIEKEKND